MSTPALQLQTLFLLDGEGRISATRSPEPSPGPLFMLIRGTASCAWAVREDVPREIADELQRSRAGRAPRFQTSDKILCMPNNTNRWLMAGLIPGLHSRSQRRSCNLAARSLLMKSSCLTTTFRVGRRARFQNVCPLSAVVEEGYPVSVCFCARRSNVAAEAGLETAVAYSWTRTRFTRVAAAWALAIRASGSEFHSTVRQWSNGASRAVARKLGLVAYASNWNIS